MTELELLENTIEYYSKKPRALCNEYKICVMINKDGHMCAVSRWLKPQVNRKKLNLYFSSIRNLLEEKILTKKDFLPEVQNINKEFWQDLQTLHDTNSYWKEKSLSESGKQKVDEMKKLYNL